MSNEQSKTTPKRYTPLQSSFLSQAVAYLSEEARKCLAAANQYPPDDMSEHKRDWLASRFACLDGADALQKVIDGEQFNG